MDFISKEVENEILICIIKNYFKYCSIRLYLVNERAEDIHHIFGSVKVEIFPSGINV